MPVRFSHVCFVVVVSMNDFLPGCLFAVVIKCFMIGVNVWWVYLAPQNIPRVISVLTLGNKVILLYCVFNFCFFSLFPPHGHSTHYFPVAPRNSGVWNTCSQAWIFLFFVTFVIRLCLLRYSYTFPFLSLSGKASALLKEPSDKYCTLACTVWTCNLQAS